ncbi:translation initiation factor IF-3, mitochondrial-like [Colias croceus]|uniref:translation initiation factor IF-3, mitochondrial-like n=1 Tax=Colias crocea TaxID=72248 RepID=UPI001E279EF7|nr:translation initiation factor IF-3, mitochondrial-like [Colias croceus]
MNKLFTLSRFKQILECRSITMKISADGKDVPKKKFIESRITLIGSDNSISITDLKSAQSLSMRRDLKLVKIQDEDSKTRRPVYKLMTNAEYHQEELSRRKEKQEKRENNFIKGQKLLTLSARIAEHDLMTRVKKIGKLLEKQYEVKVVVSGGEKEDDAHYERIYSIMEKNLQSTSKIVQKRIKGNTLRFQFLPLRQSSDDGNDSQSSQKNEKDGPL